MTITYTKESITPAVAEQMMKHNTRNRNMNENYVRSLAALMESDNWRVNGDTIKFSDLGDLLDGQNRLAAIILSGRTQDMFVVRGLEPGAFDTIDTNRPRRAVDMIYMEGYSNPAYVAAGASTLWRMITAAPGKEKVPPHYIVQTISRYPEVVYWAQKINTSEARRVVSAASLITALVYLDAIVGDKPAAEAFLTKIATGENLHKGDPVYALRNRVISHRLRKGRNDVGTVWPSVVRCLDAIEAGERIERMQLRPDNNNVQQPFKLYEHLSKLTSQKRLVDLMPGSEAHNATSAGKLVKRLKASNIKSNKAKQAAA